MPTESLIVLVNPKTDGNLITVGILNGHRVLVTGVLTDDSLAFGIAQRALAEGAEVILTSFGRAMSLTVRTARKLGDVGEIVSLDVANPDEIARAVNSVTDRCGHLDGLVHAIGYAPENCLGHGMFVASPDEIATAFQVSTFSLAALVGAFRPLLAKSTVNGGASVLALDFDATRAYPLYDWMGVAKGALESLSRYLAKEVGPDHIRVNLLAAGPIRTIAAKSIPGFQLFEDSWGERAPLGWDVRNSEAVSDTAVAMLSPYLRATTGSIVYVDGGVHAMG
jgi:meromycolic acid enoyl-[acyl-carrier-protein] reductase